MSSPISFRDVGVRFTTSTPSGSSGSLDVLRGIDLEVTAGELICLVGPSGCGKSTLLNVAGGFLPPDRGEVRIAGEVVTGPHPKRIFIFQENAVFPWLTVEQNIGFGLGSHPAAERQRIIAKYVGMIGLGGFENSYPRQLSGGMRQRVELARALATEPDVLFMDEPFGALDYLTRLRLRAELVEIWQRLGQTILFVTHDVDEAIQLADRIVVFSDRPAVIRSILPVPLNRPRDADLPGYRQLRDELFDALGFQRPKARGPVRLVVP